jgi:zinc protease
MPLRFLQSIIRLFSLTFLSALLANVILAASPWPHELGDVPPDPAIRWGRLENGLRYAVRKNTEPAGRVYLILQVAVGSVHERDDQRGYAHFVEHMMFRGTRKYPATSIVNFLQHEGLEWEPTAAHSPTSPARSTTSTCHTIRARKSTSACRSCGTSPTAP